MAEDVRDPGLWSHYVAYIKTALALIRKHQNGERVPMLLVIRLFDALKKLAEFQDLHRYALSSPLANQLFVDAAGKLIQETDSQSHWLMNFYMMPVLSQYIGPELMLEFDERRARSVYADLESFLGATQAVYSIMAPLQHFEGPDEEIRLDAKMVLRKLTQDEMQYLMHPDEFGGMVQRRDALSMRFCLAASLVTEKGAITKLSEVHAPVMRVVTALRLLKSGQVGVPTVSQRLREPAFGPMGGTLSISGAAAALGPNYRLLSEESEPLIAMYQALAEAASAEHLRIPLRRFNYAYERGRPDDRLIDYWIALEALFLPGISDELSFRASLRIAYYVAKPPDEREEIFNKMRLSYDTRSRVVHGERPKADVRGVASDTEEILRRALRAEVMSPGSLDVGRLDAAIARGQGAAQSGGTR